MLNPRAVAVMWFFSLVAISLAIIGSSYLFWVLGLAGAYTVYAILP